MVNEKHYCTSSGTELRMLINVVRPPEFIQKSLKAMPTCSCFSLCSYHGSSLSYSSQCFSEVPSTTHKGNSKHLLVNMVLIVSRGQYWGGGVSNLNNEEIGLLNISKGIRATDTIYNVTIIVS